MIVIIKILTKLYLNNSTLIFEYLPRSKNHFVKKNAPLAQKTMEVVKEEL